ncbi:unnamed protein product [Adineta ricciae]|uniref:Amino acid transporter transmembrane domain-containing protein n=1 Tax=Adineta ricciae TaxID=249248 RepID=A0A816D1Y4_ADIRI|nr:unnamed protein product [Adineta ricciae]
MSCSTNDLALDLSSPTSTETCISEQINSAPVHDTKHSKNDDESTTLLLSTPNTNEPKTTNSETLMHIINCSFGVGILALPHALSKAGLLFGSIAFWIVSILLLYCMHQLIRCCRYYRQYSTHGECDYGDIMQYTLEKCQWSFLNRNAMIGRSIIDICIIVMKFGSCSIYFVLISANIKQVMDYYLWFHPSIQLYELFVLLIVVSFSFLRNLKLLAPLSYIGNLVTMAGLIIIFQYVIRDHVPFDKLPLVTPTTDWPIFFADVMLIFSVSCVILPIRAEMQEPHAFDGWFGILNIGIVIVTALHFLIGFFGYIRYGSEIRGSITLNLPQDNRLYQFVNVLYALSILLTYNLQMHIPFTLLWQRISVKFDSKYSTNMMNVWKDFFRILTILLTFFVAMLVPHIGLVVAFVGAVSSSLLTVLFPPICETLTFWPNDLGRFKWQLILNIFIISFGLYVFLFGTVLSLSDIFICVRHSDKCDD